MAETFNLKIGGTGNGNEVTYGSMKVPYPKNYTNNKAFIGQHPLTDTPSENASPINIGEWTNANAGQLISCFEIDWGDAQEGWKTDNTNWNNKKYTFPDSIKTSSDLLRYIFMLRYKIEHSAADTFAISGNGLHAQATVVTGSPDVNAAVWKILSDTSSNYENVHLSTTTGYTTDLQGDPKGTDAKGTITITKGEETTSSVQLNATFHRAQTEAQLKARVTATVEGATVVPNSSYADLFNEMQTIQGLAENTNGWTWQVTGEGAAYCGFGDVKTHSVLNTTNSQNLVWDSAGAGAGKSVTIEVSNENAESYNYPYTLTKEADKISLTASGLKATAYIISGNPNLDNITWTYDSSMSQNYNNICLTTYTGYSTTLVGDLIANNAYGTIGDISCSLTESTGEFTVSAEFIQSSKTALLKALVTPTLSGATIIPECTYLANDSQTITGKPEATNGWNWTISGDDSGLFGNQTHILNSTNPKTFKLKASKFNGQTINITATNTNASGSASKDFTFPVLKYWYAGTTPIDPSNYKNPEYLTNNVPSSTTLKLNDEYIYIILPPGKNIEVLTSDGDTINFYTYDETTNTFNFKFTQLSDGYTLYKSRGTITDSAAEIKVTNKN